MKVLDLEQNTQEWLEARKGKITSSKVGDILSKRDAKSRKVGFYQLIADKLSIEEDGNEDAMDRGHRLETEALDLFEVEMGKVLIRGKFCVSDENENMAVSPDGLIKIKSKYTGAVEVKCLGAARHLQAYFEGKVQSEYELQILQYFVVIPDLECLFFVYYDPRVTAMPLHYITVFREDIQDQIDLYKAQELEILMEVEDLVSKLAF